MSKSLDRLTLLTTFARIAERGSISAAARDIGLSQASASRQLAELEDRLGVQLIQRTTHSLTLTEAGKAALDEARELLAGWDSLSERFAGEDTDIKGNLKVVAPVALGQMQLAEAALNFQLEHPGVMMTWLLDDQAINVTETGCDLWIKIGKPSDDRLIVRDIGKVQRIVVAAPKLLTRQDVQRPSDLAKLPCAALGPFEGGNIPLLHTSGKKTSVTSKPAIATNNIFSAYKAAKMGIGFAIMPRWFVEKELTEGSLIDVLPEWRAPELTITACYLPMRRQTKRLRLFIEHIEVSLQQIDGIGTE